MKDSMKYLALVTQVGLTIVISVSLFTLLGVYLDRWLGTRGIVTVVFVLVGCIAALWIAVKLILDTLSKDSEPK